MRAVLSVVALIALSQSCFAQPQKREPKYKGKPLAYWVERLPKAESDAEQNDAAKAIMSFGRDAVVAVPKLAEMFDDHSPEYRWLLCSILSKLGPLAKDAVPELTGLLKEQPDADPLPLISTLGSIGPEAKAAVPVLIPFLEQEKLWDNTLAALCQIGPDARAAIPAIQKSILDRIERSRQERDVSFHSVRDLHQLGPDVVPVLLAMLDKEPRLHPAGYAFEGLEKLGPQAAKAAPKLSMMLQHEDCGVRFNAAGTLWKIEKNKEVIPVLTALLKDKESAVVSRAAAEMLGEIGPDAKAALPTLREAQARGFVEWYFFRPYVIHPGFPEPAAIALGDAAKEAIKKIEAPKEGKDQK